MALMYMSQYVFQSTSLSRGKTRAGRRSALLRYLSIHFPLTREDESSIKLAHFVRAFNPLPSHEGRLESAARMYLTGVFQSTSLSRGKTLRKYRPDITTSSFNPLPSHEGRQSFRNGNSRIAPFNPLPSHEGRQTIVCIHCVSPFFQSTSLSRGKTVFNASSQCSLRLSIHFPLTREDLRCSQLRSNRVTFQSTSLSRGKTRTPAENLP